MATTTNSPSPTDPNVGPTPSASPSAKSSSNTASLYLFTFLATILILVLLSASLVLRSYILRRRYRQRFQAFTDPSLYPPLDGSGPDTFDLLDPWERFRRRATRRGLGPKPVLWDTWIHPVEKDNSWSAITPVAVRCSPSRPLTPISQSEPTPAPPVPPSHPSFLSHLRITNPFSISSWPTLPPPKQAPTPMASPSPPAAPKSPEPDSCSEKDASTLSVYVFVAMPDASTPVHHPLPDVKGKGVDPLESQAPHHGGDADPLLPSSLHRPGPSAPDSGLDESGLPLIELGVVEVKTGDWIWDNE